MKLLEEMSQARTALLQKSTRSGVTLPGLASGLRSTARLLLETLRYYKVNATVKNYSMSYSRKYVFFVESSKD